jgi:F-type H+-transporting ATPase subunit delta
MNESKISVRYAKAFFSLAQEKNVLSEVSSDVTLLHELHKDANFRILLTDPVISTKQKKNIFKNVFEGNVNELTLRFLYLMAENGREDYLPITFLNFLTLYRKYTGIEQATLTTTYELSPELRATMKLLIERLFNTKVELSERIDEELIGGFVLRVGDKQLDSSIARKLEDTKKALLLSK